MITTKDNGPVKFLADGETPFDEIQQTDCNCKGREFCQIVHSGDNTPFQVDLSESTGLNMAVNGTFTTDTSWTKGTGWTIGLGRASHSGGGGGLSQIISGLKASTYYKITFSVSSYSNSQTMSVTFTNDTIKTINANGTYTVYWFTDATLGNSAILFLPHTSTTLNIDDVSVYEMATVVYGIKDMDDVVIKTVSNGTGVTYYQEVASIEVDWTDVDDGCYRLFLIDNGDNLVTDGDSGTFEAVASGWNLTEGTDVDVSRVDGEVSDKTGSYKGKISILGTELVSNGGFSSGASWTTEPGWSIGAGVATSSVVGVTTNIYQTIAGVSVNGATYRLSFDVTSYSAGTSACYLGLSFGADFDITSAGSHSLDFVYDGGSNILDFYTDTVISIDNVSVKKILEPSVSLLFSGSTAITVEPNSDYEISAYINLQQELAPQPPNITAITQFMYLKPTTYALSQCKSVSGVNSLVNGVFRTIYNIVYENGNYIRRVARFSSGGSVYPDSWIRISTLFNTGDNTSINIGLYLGGDLSTYNEISDIYIDDLQMRGPIDLESECFKVGTFDCTQVLSWSSNENSYGYTYEGTNFQHETRVQSKLWQPGYKKEKKEVFTDSAGTRRILTSRTKKEEILTIGEIPTYLHDAISIGVEHDNFYVDGVKYINEETDYDPDWRKSSLLAPVELKVVKDSQNLQNSYC